jgi:DNA-binding Lrp family transcriptional regulator
MTSIEPFSRSCSRTPTFPERSSLTPSICPLRPSNAVNRLKQDGIIEKIVAVLSPKAVDRTLSILIELEIQNEHRHTLEQFQRWLDRAPEIQSCWYLTGDADYVLLVAVRNLEDYNAFIDRLMNEQQALVRKYKSLIALKTIKHGLSLSVHE